MNINEIKTRINSNEYDFLRNNVHLQDNLILLGLGGSYAYGTEVESSDLDIRGVALNSQSDILDLNQGFEQFTDNNSDTVIYSFNKIIRLLIGCNPNVVEILGLKPEHYLYLSDIGQELIDNRHLFLSKKAGFTFGSYANSQLRRLDNKAARLASQDAQEHHILKSIENAAYTFKHQFFSFDDDAIKLYIDKSEQEEYDTEIFMDVNLKHYPLRDYKGMWSVMNNIVKDYAKIGKRNSHAIEHNKLSKHMMHLVRLYLMCLDILNNGEIVTYREKDHDFLMSIRAGKYLDDNRQPTSEFFDIVDDLESKLDAAKKTTDLPDVPNYKKISEFVVSVNERIVRGEI